MNTTKELSIKFDMSGKITSMDRNALLECSYLRIDTLKIDQLFFGPDIQKFKLKLSRVIQQQTGMSFQINLKTKINTLTNALCDLQVENGEVCAFFYINDSTKRKRRSIGVESYMNPNMNFLMSAPSFI